ncbi:MAG TPA: diaminopimelate epimerase [Thermodesulfovibrionales bacterium]|nr:diaminopimelate epimerase [Thermodesulfovibrionales bacterium]
MKMRFTKMHGLGNDFILIDCMTDTCPPEMGNAEAFSRHLCDRRFGIGADQLLLLYPSETADFRMRILNSDGSEVEMCGNGVRCFAKYVWDRGLSDKDILSIETLAGVVKPEKMGDMVRVDMGEPALEPERIPVRLPHASGGVVDYPLRIDDREFRITCVSMGNPHAVIVVDDSAVFPVEKYGPLIEVHPVFPKKTNVEFIEIISRREIRMRVWERGAGETMACGTGASAVAVAASLKGLTDRDVTVHLRGGDLSIEWASDNHVYMTGPAVEVFEGTIDLAM